MKTKKKFFLLFKKDELYNKQKPGGCTSVSTALIWKGVLMAGNKQFIHVENSFDKKIQRQRTYNREWKAHARTLHGRKMNKKADCL